MESKGRNMVQEFNTNDGDFVLHYGVLLNTLMILGNA